MALLPPSLNPRHPHLMGTQTYVAIFCPRGSYVQIFSFSCLHKSPYNARKGWTRKLCPIFYPSSWLAKKVWSPKNVKSFHPPPTRGPARIPASLRSAMEGGGPLRGWMKGLNIFWTLHFLSSQLLRSCPEGLSHLPQRGGATSKNVLVFGLCMCLSRNVKNLP